LILAGVEAGEVQSEVGQKTLTAKFAEKDRRRWVVEEHRVGGIVTGGGAFSSRILDC